MNNFENWPKIDEIIRESTLLALEEAQEKENIFWQELEDLIENK